MRVASLVMAILATVFGTFWGLIAIWLGAIGNELGSSEGDDLIYLGISAILACAMGMTCSALHFSGKRQGLMAGLIAIAALWHVISIGMFGIPGLIFFLLAALFAALGRDSALQSASAPAPSVF